MPKNLSKDISPLVPSIAPAAIATLEDNKPGKNHAAAAALGGLKGGNAMAEALSNKQRSELAKKAALARWKKKD
jgi:hypothetical protein